MPALTSSPIAPLFTIRPAPVNIFPLISSTFGPNIDSTLPLVSQTPIILVPSTELSSSTILTTTEAETTIQVTSTYSPSTTDKESVEIDENEKETTTA